MGGHHNSRLIERLTGQSVVVVLGAGGVGKTTTSIACAVLAAMEGRRVALLSIDPAKRLAAALGIPLSNNLKRIAFPAGMNVSGSLHAAMLDQKAVFDMMVHRHAPSADIAEQILAHPLYRAASTNLSGPLEYMALAKLEDLAEHADYDLVILDTPPDTQALDFLSRPNVLGGFMENRVMGWLIKPFLVAGRFGLGRLLSMGERLMGGVAKVTGVKALRSFAEFLVLMQEVIDGFHRTGERIVELLHRPSTSFFMMAAPSRAACRSAVNLAYQLDQLGYGTDLVLFNRCLPRQLARAVAEVQAGQHPRSQRPQKGPPNDFDVLASRLHGEEVVMAQLQEKVRGGDGDLAIVRLAEQEVDLHNMTAIVGLAKELEASSKI